MTDSKITGLTALTGANLATGDVFEVSDISDTTMDASGTSKKITAAELAAGLSARPYRYETGLYYQVPPSREWSTLVATAGLEYVYPFFVDITATFDRIGFECTATSASSSVRLGIRADDGTGWPSATVILDAGTVTTASGTGFKEATISQQLTPGVYWFSVTAQGGTPTLRSVTAIVMQSLGWYRTAPVTTQEAVAHSQTGVTGALPSSFTKTINSSDVGTAGAILGWLRAA